MSMTNEVTQFRKPRISKPPSIASFFERDPFNSLPARSRPSCALWRLRRPRDIERVNDRAMRIGLALALGIAAEPVAAK
jgi:hypothetical protein